MPAMAPSTPDTDDLLDSIRQRLKEAVLETAPGHRQSVKDVHDLFAQLDDALCSGEDLPSEWLTEDVGGDDDDDEPEEVDRIAPAEDDVPL